METLPFRLGIVLAVCLLVVLGAAVSVSRRRDRACRGARKPRIPVRLAEAPDVGRASIGAPADVFSVVSSWLSF